MKTILVTGGAGFIGFHLTQRLLQDSTYRIIFVDNLNEYYDVQLKKDRLKQVGFWGVNQCDKIYELKNSLSSFAYMDICDKEQLFQLFEQYRFDYVINLAAQAGVRYSLQHPESYIDCNITGFLNVLEACRHYPVEHLIYASSSSVYGANKSIPFKETDAVDQPVSLYAATKKANELMAHTYSHLFNIPCTGLRFFTVYGPWGRPDMAYFSFTKKILSKTPIQIYNLGKMKRDFTYIDDIVQGIYNLIPNAPRHIKTENSLSKARCAVYNIGNNKPVELMEFVNILECILGAKADIQLLPMQPGDVESTYADISSLQTVCGFEPKIEIKEGLSKFYQWYRLYYNI